LNELKLSDRLHTVCTYIPKGAVIADIGSDHAYLPCYAAIHGMIKKGIAGEVNEGPFQSAQNQVKTLNLEAIIDVRKGNGLEVIAPNEVNTITIAGMGGNLISSILEEGKEKLQGVNHLILQPNVGAQTVREWLLHHQFELKDEQILEEDGKVYEVLYAIRGDGSKPYSNELYELMFGPFLLKTKNTAFYKKWEAELQGWKQVLQQLEKATTAQDDKQNELINKIKMVEEVLS
jgi:tRNA (adenine22-N1)-methyltransferase